MNIPTGWMAAVMVANTLRDVPEAQARYVAVVNRAEVWPASGIESVSLEWFQYAAAMFRADATRRANEHERIER